MRTRAIILAGGEGSRLSVLTAKRTKPAVPFGGKYRIMDFPLSNCVNSGLYDVMVLAQYRPQSLIEHVGSGAPWDLDRSFLGGVRVHTPYKARFGSDWYVGTADAVQQNFTFIKQGRPDEVLILSGDHIYSMDYGEMIAFHRACGAAVTLATIRVPLAEASRFGIVGADADGRVTSFVEKPADPPSDLANMGVYVFDIHVLDRVLWEDHERSDSAHDFGKNILPRLVADGAAVYAFPFNGYWVDVGTTESYWQAHMDLLLPDPPIKLHDRDWVIHTRTEERPPARLAAGSAVADSLISHGCVIEAGARVERCVLSPGVIVRAGAFVRESILLTDVTIEREARVNRAILDKKVRVGERAGVGEPGAALALVGKNSEIMPGMTVQPGGVVATDVIASDYPAPVVKAGDYIETKRKPYEV